MAKLQQLGGVAVTPLEKVLDARPTLEVRRRVEAVLAKVENQPMPGELLQTLRALARIRLRIGLRRRKRCSRCATALQ